MRLQVRRCLDDIGRTDEPSDAPAGHGVGLRNAVDDDAGVGETGNEDGH